MKLDKHAWILWGIALAMTIALMLLIPFEHTAVWWIAFCSTVLMFALCAFTFARAFHKADTLESKFLGWPIFRVGYTAVFLQIVIGFSLMAIAPFCPAWVAAVIELIVFSATAFCLTGRDAAREIVAGSEIQIEDKTGAWKTIRLKASAIAAETDHPELRRLAEAVRMADPMPCSMDKQIAEMISSLGSAADESTIKKVLQMLEQRKVQIKMEKKN